MLTQKQVETIVKEYVLNEAKKRKGFSLTRIVVFESTKLQSVAHKPVFESKGYFEYNARSDGRLLSYRVRQRFTSQVDAENGKMVTCNTEPAEEIQKSY